MKSKSIILGLFILIATFAVTGGFYYRNVQMKHAMLAIVSNNGLALENTSHRFKNDKDIVLAAIKQNGVALKYASENLKNDKEVVLAAVKNDFWAFQDASNSLKNDKDVVIKAMFTDGNIKDLQVAFLSPEDRQTFKANVLYRNEKENGFSENESKIIRLHGTEYNDDPLETFDLTGFCTSVDHAVKFGKYVLA